MTTILNRGEIRQQTPTQWAIGTATAIGNLQIKLFAGQCPQDRPYHLTGCGVNFASLEEVVAYVNRIRDEERVVSGGRLRVCATCGKRINYGVYCGKCEFAR